MTLVSVTTTHNWEARSAAGVTVATFGSADLAAGWVEDEGPRLPGHKVVRITTRVTETVLFEDADPERKVA